MRLIGLAVVLAPTMVLAPMAVDAEPAGKIHRIGFIGFQSPGAGEPHDRIFPGSARRAY
jgi:hypothetical protein